MSSLPRSIPRNKEIRWLCGAQFSSLTATYALYLASIALVEDMTHSSTQMGVMLFSSTLPGLLFGLVAGIVVDRRERVGKYDEQLLEIETQRLKEAQAKAVMRYEELKDQQLRISQLTE